MKLASLPIGTAVCLGRVDKVERGEGGFPALFLGRGKYTLAYQPCGEYIVQPSDHARVQAVIAMRSDLLRDYLRTMDRSWYRLPKGQDEWVPWLLGSSMLRMSWAEYELKRTGVLEEKAMRQVRLDHKAELRRLVLEAMLDKLPPFEWRTWGGDSINIELEDLASWFQKRKPSAAKAIREYLNYDVEVCET